MSYNKMMERAKGHRHDKDYQPVLVVPFKENEHVESLASIAERTAKSYHVRVRNSVNEKFIKISEDFPTEDDAVQYCTDNDLDNKYLWVRIYTDKGLYLSGWQNEK